MNQNNNSNSFVRDQMNNQPKTFSSPVSSAKQNLNRKESENFNLNSQDVV